MEERKRTSSSAETEDKAPSLQQRVQEGTSSFDFDALLRGVSEKVTTEPRPDSRPAHPTGRPRGTTPPHTSRTPLLAGVAVAVIVSLLGTYWLVAGRHKSAQNGGPNIVRNAKEAASLPSGETVLSSEEIAAYSGKMRVHIPHTLTGPLSYWFVSASQQASAPHPLDHPDDHGNIVLTIPAAYNQPDAQLRIHDLGQGKIARMDVIDFTHPEMLTKQLVGPNLLKNADFEDGTTAWAMEQDGAIAHGTLQLKDGLEGPVGVTGHIAELKVTAIDNVNWHLQCIQGGLTLKEGKKYQVAFWAKCDRERTLPINAQLDLPDWHMVGLASSVALTPRWQKYSLVFTAHTSVAGHTRLVVLMGDAVGTVELTGISLRRLLGDNISKKRDPDSAAEIDPAAFH